MSQPPWTNSNIEQKYRKFIKSESRTSTEQYENYWVEIYENEIKPALIKKLEETKELFLKINTQYQSPSTNQQKYKKYLYELVSEEYDDFLKNPYFDKKCCHGNLFRDIYLKNKNKCRVIICLDSFIPPISFGFTKNHILTKFNSLFNSSISYIDQFIFAITDYTKTNYGNANLLIVFFMDFLQKFILNFLFFIAGIDFFSQNPKTSKENINDFILNFPNSSTKKHISQSLFLKNQPDDQKLNKLNNFNTYLKTDKITNIRNLFTHPWSWKQSKNSNDQNNYSIAPVILEFQTDKNTGSKPWEMNFHQNSSHRIYNKKNKNWIQTVRLIGYDDDSTDILACVWNNLEKSTKILNEFETKTPKSPSPKKTSTQKLKQSSPN